MHVQHKATWIAIMLIILWHMSLKVTTKNKLSVSTYIECNNNIFAIATRLSHWSSSVGLRGNRNKLGQRAHGATDILLTYRAEKSIVYIGQSIFGIFHTAWTLIRQKKLQSCKNIAKQNITRRQLCCHEHIMTMCLLTIIANAGHGEL